MEAWELLQDDKILKAASAMNDHLMSEVGPTKDDIIQTGNFYGIPSTSILTPVIKLYRATENKDYLEFGEYIVKQWRALKVCQRS